MELLERWKSAASLDDVLYERRDSFAVMTLNRPVVLERDQLVHSSPVPGAR